MRKKLEKNTKSIEGTETRALICSFDIAKRPLHLAISRNLISFSAPTEELVLDHPDLVSRKQFPPI